MCAGAAPLMLSTGALKSECKIVLDQLLHRHRPSADVEMVYGKDLERLSHLDGSKWLRKAP